MLSYFNKILGLLFDEEHLGDILFKFYYKTKEITQRRRNIPDMGLRSINFNDYAISVGKEVMFTVKAQIICSTIDYTRRLIYFCDKRDKISVRRLDDMQLVTDLPKPRGKNNINISSLVLVNDLLLGKCSGSIVIYNTKPFEFIDSIFGILEGVIAKDDHLILYIQFSNILTKFKFTSDFKLSKFNELKLPSFQDVKILNSQLYIKYPKELHVLDPETFELLEQLPFTCTSFNINSDGEMVYWINNCFTVDGNHINVGENILSIEFNGNELRIYQLKSLSVYNRRVGTIKHDRVQHINFYYQ